MKMRHPTTHFQTLMVQHPTMTLMQTASQSYLLATKSCLIRPMHRLYFQSISEEIKGL